MEVQVVVLAVIQKNDTFLFTLRLDGESVNNGKWQLPGGGLEFAETPEEALHREVREELGIEVNIIKLIPKIVTKVRGKWQGILLSYLCELKDIDCKIVLNEEASEYKWMKTEELANVDSLDGCIEILNQ